MSHHTSLNGPKYDHPDAGDQPTASYDPLYSGYPVPPRLYGTTQSLKPLRQRRGYGYSPRSVFWTLQLALWLVNLFVISYCVYYLWPFPPLSIFGIPLHP